MAAAQAAKNHGDEWCLTWYFWWGICKSIPPWTHSQNSLEAAESLSLKISSHGTSLKWSRRPAQSAREKSWNMRWNRASCFEFIGKSTETETTAWSEFPYGGKAIVEQILASEERNKSKRAGPWESHSGIRVGKFAIWVRSFEIEKL